MKTYNVKAVIEVLPNGKTDVLYEAAPEVFVELDEFLAMKKERGEQAVKEVKKISKKEKVKAFLAKLIEKKRKKKPFHQRLEEAKKQAQENEEKFGYGAGDEYLNEWLINNKEEYEAYIKEKKAEKESKLKFVHNSYVFRFGTELGGVSGAEGLDGFSDVYVNKYKKRFTELSKSAREKIAKDILKTLFPSATRFESLVVSAFTNPSQTDGGIEIYLWKNMVKGKLLYEEVYKPNTDYLSKATKIVLK